MKTTNHECRKRRGHSMMEMVVVMSVLAGMAALAWPMLKSPMSKLRLQAAAQEVSAALAKARLKAMQSGEAQVFRFQMHTGKFQVTAFSEEETTVTEPSERTEQIAADVPQHDSSEHSPMTEASDSLLEENELPDGICFEVPMDDEFPDVERTEVAEQEQEWTDLAIFYPNGGTTNAVVGLRGEPDFHVDVKLSGLTGIAKIGETRRQELR